MPGPKEISKEKEMPKLEFRETENNWIVADHEKGYQIQPQQVLQNQSLNGAVYAQPEKIHEHVIALNKYLETRKNKEWATTYDDYKKLAAILTHKANLQNMQTKQSSWNKLEEEAKAALEQVMAMDDEQQKIRENTTFFTLDKEIDDLLLDKNKITDSSLYRGVLRAAQAYKEEKDMVKKMACLAKLKTKMDAYASVRFKRSYSYPKGERRMGRVTKMLTMTNKLLQCRSIIELSAKQQAEVSAVYQDINQYHKKDATAIVNSRKVPGITNVSRWSQAMLPYKRDEKGYVTPETAANYAENVELLEAFKSDDVIRQKVAICRIYQRINFSNYDNNTFTIDGILKEAESIFGQKGLCTNKNALMDILLNFKNDQDPVIKYVSARIGDTCRSFMESAIKNYLLSLGYNYQTAKFIKKKDVGQYKNSEQAYLQNAKRIFDGDVDIKGSEEAYAARNEEMEKSIQDYINNNTRPESIVYLQKTASLFQENMKLQEEVDESFSTNHPEEYASTKYWVQHTRQGNFMLPLEKDKNGKLTVKGQQNYQYNEKMVKLLNSEDPTDRIAALASCFLRCYWEGLTEDQLTASEFSKYMRKLIQTEGFYSQYNDLEDFVKAELARDKNNELVIYMKNIIFSAKSQQASLLSQAYFTTMGYSTDGINKKIKPHEMEAHILTLKLQMDTAKEAFKTEREKNNGNLITVDPAMTAKLEKLCKDKGLM